MINKFADIHPNAKLANNVAVGAFSSIADSVEIGEGTIIHSNVTIYGDVVIGKNCQIFPGAVIGAIPQDLKFEGEKSIVIIGDNNTIRECVTINKGTSASGKTVVGSNCLLMAYTHIAHDCVVGNNVILGNLTQLAGEVEVDDWAIMGGGTLVHQFVKVGKHVMIQGGSKVSKDVPPFVTAGREPLQYAGVNSIGLRRRGFTNAEIGEIQSVYRYLYQSGMNITHAVEEINKEIAQSEMRDEVLEFIKKSTRGLMKGYFD